MNARLLATLLTALLALLPACGGAGEGEEAAAPPETGAATATEAATKPEAEQEPATAPEETTAEEEEEGPEVPRPHEIWLAHEGFLRLAWRLGSEEEEVARVALESLLEERGLTAIPADTTLRGVAIAGDTATVDLSGGLGRGKRARLALAQIVYTVTQFENVRSVEVVSDGAPLQGLAGPHTREELEDVLAPVVVQSPTGLEPVRSPIVVAGTANTFEANVLIEVVGERGEELASTFTTATCGSGCRGDFREAVEVRVPQQTSVTLRVSEDDPSGGEGRPPYTIEIPLFLGP